MKVLSSLVITMLIFVAAQGQAVETSAPDTRSLELQEAVRLTESAVEFSKQGKAMEALTLALRALELREKHLGDADLLLRTARANVAELYIAKGNYGDAERLFKRILASYTDRTAADLKLASVYDRMAVLYYALSRLSESEESYRSALKIREKVFGSNSVGIADSLFQLGEYYQFTGKYKEAEPYYQQLLKIRETHADQKDKLDQVLERYGCLLRKRNRQGEAQELEARLFGPPAFATGNVGGAIDGGILNGRALSLPRPRYPEQARSARASGKVVVRVHIDERGRVFSACAISGHPLLVRNSEFAAYGARFSPTKVSGMPVRVFGVITYNYVPQ